MTNQEVVYHDGDDCIRGDLTDLNMIVDHVDTAYGRPKALRAYIYALRDLQRLHDLSAQNADSNVTAADIKAAAKAVERAFEALGRAQQQHEEEEWLD